MNAWKQGRRFRADRPSDICFARDTPVCIVTEFLLALGGNFDQGSFLGHVGTEGDLLVSEVADYKLRRELLRISSHKRLARLDELTRELRYLPTATATSRAAAQLWAEQRRAGRSLQRASMEISSLQHKRSTSFAAVVTLNEKHFTGIVEALSWSSVPLLQSS